MDQRHHCLDHVTRGHTGESGSNMSATADSACYAGPRYFSMPLVPSPFCPCPHGPTLESNPPRNSRLRLIMPIREGAEWTIASPPVCFRQPHRTIDRRCLGKLIAQVAAQTPPYFWPPVGPQIRSEAGTQRRVQAFLIVDLLQEYAD